MCYVHNQCYDISCAILYLFQGLQLTHYLVPDSNINGPMISRTGSDIFV